MPLRLYNTLTRRKEDFSPLDSEQVRMYVCGPTVYDRAHIGNARPVIVFDVLFRLLRHLYPGEDRVRYVRNITDIDDKIILRAAERGISIGELTDETTRAFEADVAALGCLPPTVEPRATEHIPEMIAVIERLIASGHAYVAQGNVLFDVPSMPDYGALSHRTLDEMIAGARVEVAPYKRHDTDFVLWKPSANGEPGWPSAWGRGRPGWHIECSAMSWKHLGETFDIHGGGIDLVFPHHENERAQSCCAFDRPLMAQVWMHNGFLQVEGRKMSKSLGNFVTIADVLAQRPANPYWGEVVRLNMLRTHYRQPIDWSQDSLSETEVIYDHFLNAVRGTARGSVRPSANVIELLKDDLNTPEAIMEMQRLAGRDRIDGMNRRAPELTASLKLLGFFEFKRDGTENSVGTKTHFTDSDGYDHELENDLLRASAGMNLDDLKKIIASRLAARAQKNWAESDRIRDELAAMGVKLKDNKDGTTTWDLDLAGRR